MEIGLVSDLVLQYLEQRRAGSPLPLKLQLYAALRDAILEDRLAPGTQLPPTRNLAQELGMGRNTVLAAYEQLLAEGYVNGRVGAGTFVADTLPDQKPLRTRKNKAAATPALQSARGAEITAGTVQLSRRGTEIAAHADSSKVQHGAFMPGIPDVAHFPYQIWKRLLGKYLAPENTHMLQYSSGGYGPLKVALAEYLKVSRFVDCQPRQIILLNGTHQALDLIARMLTDPGDSVWVEDPGYWGARNVFRADGLNIVGVPVDEHGIAPADEAWQSPPKLVFVTPSNQYPTGVVLSLARRRALIEQANKAGAWIIEDDYDNELRYHARPLASLYSLAGSERVIYAGTFSKVLFPGLRLAYLVVPLSLVDAFTTGNAELYREGRVVEQAALAEFISSGYFASHIRKMRLIYAERQRIIRERLAQEFGDKLQLTGGDGGIHLLYYLPDGIDDEQVCREAMAAGVILRPLSVYYHDQTRRRPGIMIGYAGVPTDKIGPALDRLVPVLRRALGL